MAQPGESRKAEIEVDSADLEDLHLVAVLGRHDRRVDNGEGHLRISVGASLDTALEDTFAIR